MTDASAVFTGATHHRRSGLDVQTLCSLVDLRARESELTALHATSIRGSPFSTPSFIMNYLEHDEYTRVGDEVLILLAFEDAQLIGYLPLRLRRGRALGLPYTKVECLVTHDGDLPHVVSAAADEARCAEAFLRELTRRGWDFIELMEQDASSPFFAAAQALDSKRFYVRRFVGESVAMIVNRYDALAQYYGAMTGKFRSNLRRGAAALFALDGIEYLASRDARGAALLLDSYLDVERASWKASATATICRHPERLSFFRRLAGERLPFEVSIELLLHRGRPIAGLINGAYGRGYYALQIAYDLSYESVAPGTMLLLLAMKRVIDERMAFYDLQHGSTYYKTRLLAEVTETESVQIYRRGNRPYYRARLGELRQTLRAWRGAAAKSVGWNALKRSAKAAPRQRTAEPGLRAYEQTCPSRHVARLATPSVVAVTQDELIARMPFTLRPHV